MKRLTGVLVVVIMVLFHGNAFADTLEVFSEAIHAIEEEFENIFESFGDALEEEGSLSLNEIRAATEKIKTEAESIVALGKENDRSDWVFEADELAEVVEELMECLEEKELDEALFNLAMAFHNFSTLQMVSPRFARNALSEHYKEVKDVLTKGDVVGTAEAVERQTEHMEDLARHLHYASKIFGKKVWRKFAEATLEAADEMADACEDRDQAAAEAALKKIEKPIMMLEDLIQ